VSSENKALTEIPHLMSGLSSPTSDDERKTIMNTDYSLRERIRRFFESLPSQESNEQGRIAKLIALMGAEFDRPRFGLPRGSRRDSEGVGAMSDIDKRMAWMGQCRECQAFVALWPSDETPTTEQEQISSEWPSLAECYVENCDGDIDWNGNDPIAVVIQERRR